MGSIRLLKAVSIFQADPVNVYQYERAACVNCQVIVVPKGEARLRSQVV